MIHHRMLMRAAVFVLIVAAPIAVRGAGGTTTIASKGQTAAVSRDWPAGAADLVNDPLRTTGWNSWFTEWPNDVNQYAFDVRSSDDLNRLIGKLAAIKSELRQIRLSPLKEPESLGWVTHLPAGNKIAVIFSIGDQSRIDDWYKTVRKPFGVMEFTAAPIAVPPTLTLFVGNENVNLDKIKIPKGIEVTRGYVPTVFHRFNTTLEQKQEKEDSARKAKGGERPPRQDLDKATRDAAKKIELFLANFEKGAAR